MSPTNGRPACALARRSASARRREAVPAKAGNAAGLLSEPTPPKKLRLRRPGTPAQVRPPFLILPFMG
jgi:hypothetical protein